MTETVNRILDSGDAWLKAADGQQFVEFQMKEAGDGEYLVQSSSAERPANNYRGISFDDRASKALQIQESEALYIKAVGLLVIIAEAPDAEIVS
ncbi:MAG: hypothetical protein AAF562_14810 [Pseudomonadota bacterium]